jgi:hypothetical protein
MKPDTLYEKWSASLTWFFIVTEGLFLLLFVLFVFLPCSDPAKRMNKYKNRVGAIYDNIDYTKFLNRLVPLVFIMKRVAFAIGCWYIKVELQAIFIGITLLHLCLIIHAEPYLETSLYKTEIFNELIALIFFILLQAFKPEFLEPKDQYTFGWIGIGILSTYIIVHLSLNIGPVICNCINWLKRKIYGCCYYFENKALKA